MYTKIQQKLAIESLPDVILMFRALHEHVGEDHSLTLRFRDAIGPIILGELEPAEAVTLDILEENVVLDSFYARISIPDDGSPDYAYASYKLEAVALASIRDSLPVHDSIPVNDYSNLDIFGPPQP